MKEEVVEKVESIPLPSAGLRRVVHRHGLQHHRLLVQRLRVEEGGIGVDKALRRGAFGSVPDLTAALVADEAFSQWLVNRTPSRRWGEVDELAGAAVFLASDASTFVNGHILYVDGGVTATL